MSRDHRPNSRVADRKQRQLCSVVERAIDLAFGASADPLLQGCWVVDVRPAATQAQLQVRVCSEDGIQHDDLQARLLRATPWLRSEVRVFVNRKRMPQLTLVLLP
jgi:hypothetical protein